MQYTVGTYIFCISSSSSCSSSSSSSSSGIGPKEISDEPTDEVVEVVKKKKNLTSAQKKKRRLEKIALQGPGDALTALAAECAANPGSQKPQSAPSHSLTSQVARPVWNGLVVDERFPYSSKNLSRAVYSAMSAKPGSSLYVTVPQGFTLCATMVFPPLHQHRYQNNSANKASTQCELVPVNIPYVSPRAVIPLLLEQAEDEGVSRCLASEELLMACTESGSVQGRRWGKGKGKGWSADMKFRYFACVLREGDERCSAAGVDTIDSREFAHEGDGNLAAVVLFDVACNASGGFLVAECIYVSKKYRRYDVCKADEKRSGEEKQEQDRSEGSGSPLSDCLVRLLAAVAISLNLQGIRWKVPLVEYNSQRKGKDSLKEVRGDAMTDVGIWVEAQCVGLVLKEPVSSDRVAMLASCILDVDATSCVLPPNCVINSGYLLMQVSGIESMKRLLSSAPTPSNSPPLCPPFLSTLNDDGRPTQVESMVPDSDSSFSCSNLEKSANFAGNETEDMRKSEGQESECSFIGITDITGHTDNVTSLLTTRTVVTSLTSSPVKVSSSSAAESSWTAVFAAARVVEEEGTRDFKSSIDGDGVDSSVCASSLKKPSTYDEQELDENEDSDSENHNVIENDNDNDNEKGNEDVRGKRSYIPVAPITDPVAGPLHDQEEMGAFHQPEVLARFVSECITQHGGLEQVKYCN